MKATNVSWWFQVGVVRYAWMSKALALYQAEGSFGLWLILVLNNFFHETYKAVTSSTFLTFI